MDDITIGVTEFVNNILVSAQPNDQIIDITVTETVETVLLDVSTTVEEVSVTATQNVIVENITVDYVNNENNIDINVTDATQDVTLNITPTLVEVNILRSGGEVNILQFDTRSQFPTTGSSDYFYLAKDTNKLYRWTGSAYAEISATSSPVWGQIIGTLSNQTDLQNALNLKAPLESPTFTGTVSGITKTMVGLGAVDNTSDLDKPISTATQTALNSKQPLDGDLTSIAGLTDNAGFLKKNGANSWNLDNTTYLSSISSSDVITALGYTPEDVANKGVNNGYASLGGDGKVPSSQLPSYVDDVIEVANYGSLPSTGETGKIYITLDTNKIYRWSGSVYVEISSSATVWGGITGTLSNQTDLQNALNTYYPASNPNNYTSNVGTVTAVAMSVPSAFSVSGSPITVSGTLAVTATGSSTQYIDGTGALQTFPTAGQSGSLVREVRNTTGATLTKGTIVYISGATGNKPTVSKAIATGDSTSAQTFGMVQSDIANNANGNVVCIGDITGLDTSSLTEGVQLYLSGTTAGAYTTTKSVAPIHLVYIGIVTRSHPTLGQIEVKIQNGYELDEIHDVLITSKTNNDGLFYESSSNLWKNKPISTVLGFTPANDASVVHTSGDESIGGIKTYTGYSKFNNGIYLKQDGTISGFPGHNVIDADTNGIIFGNPDLTKIAHIELTNLSGSQYFTLPNTSGTIALTSDIPSLAGYVATTGNQTISGVKTYSSDTIFDGDIFIKQDSTYSNRAGYVSIYAGSGNTLSYNFGNSNINQSFAFPSNGRSYTYPDASGTLALTSDIITYTLPIASATVLGGIKVGSNLSINATTGVLDATYSYTLPTASTTVLGGIKVDGTTITINGSGVISGTASYSLPIASSTVLGGIKVGNNLSINATTGVLDSTYSYTLPTASTSILGGVKVDGSTITINGSGVISGTASYSLPTASTSVLGGVKIDGTTITISAGVISAAGNTYTLPTATASVLGGVKIGSGVTITSGVISVSTNYQAPLSGTGLVYSTAGTITYDTNTYLTTSSAASTYLPLSGGTLTGGLAINLGSGTGLNVASNNVVFRSNTGIGSPRQAVLSMGGGTLVQLEAKGYGANYITDFGIKTYNSGGTGFDVFYGTSAGLVGIGTTTPSDILDVQKNQNATTNFYFRNTDTTNSNSRSYLNVISGSSYLTLKSIYGDHSYLDSSSNLYFQSANSVKMTILSSGNVGIGTTTPDVFSRAYSGTTLGLSSGGETAIEINSASGSSAYFDMGAAGSRFLAITSGSTQTSIATVNSAPMVFATSNAERMRITSGGDVTIGTSGTTRNLNIISQAATGAYSQLYFELSGWSAAGMLFERNSNQIKIWNGNSSVGVTLSASGTSWGSYSDERMKDIIEPITNGLQKLSELRTVIGKYKTDSEGTRRSFLIAQDVLKSFPEAVDISDDDFGTLSLKYTELIPVLVKAIQEQQAQIEELKNK